MVLYMSSILILPSEFFETQQVQALLSGLNEGLLRVPFPEIFLRAHDYTPVY
jgi:hypothetical protein